MLMTEDYDQTDEDQVTFCLFQVIQAHQHSKPGKRLSPNVYSKCKDILRSMQHSSKSQCCVLTGDSASGKTESLKHILLYIISTSIPSQPSLKAKFLQVKLSNLKFLRVSELLCARCKSEASGLNFIKIFRFSQGQSKALKRCLNSFFKVFERITKG